MIKHTPHTHAHTHTHTTHTIQSHTHNTHTQHTAQHSHTAHIHTHTKKTNEMSTLNELAIALKSGDDVMRIREVDERQRELSRVHEKRKAELKNIIASCEAPFLKFVFFCNGFFFRVGACVWAATRAAYSNAIQKTKQAHENEEKRLAKTLHDCRDVIAKQEEVKEEIAKINEKGARVLRSVRAVRAERFARVQASKWIRK